MGNVNYIPNKVIKERTKILKNELEVYKLLKLMTNKTEEGG